MTDDKPIIGSIIGVRDCGGRAIVFLDAGDGRIIPVPLDHRSFRHLLEGEGCQPDELMGRSLSYHGDLVTFLD